MFSQCKIPVFKPTPCNYAMSSPKYSDKLKIIIYIVELSVKIFTENDIHYIREK